MLDITVTPPSDHKAKDPAPERGGDNNFLSRQLEAPKRCFARIYGFSYEGHYYDLARPLIFLVHGKGKDANAPRPPGDGKGAASRFSRAPANADLSGVAVTAGAPSEDMRVWSYDKADCTVRLDVETGSFEQVLLDAVLDGDGPSAGSSGARVSGARVSGARVSGARVSGARVSGARVGGSGRGDD